MNPSDGLPRWGLLPLYSPEHRLAALISAKAGCTYMTKWFFAQIGQLERALAYHRWVHRYRGLVFQAGTGYRVSLAGIADPRNLVLKIVRNPYRRCLSAYMAFCRIAAEDRAGQEHRAVLGGLSGYLGRPVASKRTCSFEEFVAFLETVDLSSFDMHVDRQSTHRDFERTIPSLLVVKLEEANVVLPELERRQGMKLLNHDELSYSPHHARRDYYDAGYCGGREFGTVAGAKVPRPINFFSDDIRRRIYAMYEQDFRDGGYDEDEL